MSIEPIDIELPSDDRSVLRAKRIGPYVAYCRHPHLFWFVIRRVDGLPVPTKLTAGAYSNLTEITKAIAVLEQ